MDRHCDLDSTSNCLVSFWFFGFRNSILQNFKLAKEKQRRIRFVEFRKDYSERSKSRINSKNHQWPSPTRVGIDAPRGEKREKIKKDKFSEKRILLVV